MSEGDEEHLLALAEQAVEALKGVLDVLAKHRGVLIQARREVALGADDPYAAALVDIDECLRDGLGADPPYT